MPYRSKYKRRTARRQPRRAKRFRRKFRIKRGIKPTNFMTIKQKTHSTSHFITVNQAPVALDEYHSGAITFHLDDLQAYSEPVAMFDQYRINWVIVRIYFQGNSLNTYDTYFKTAPVRIAHCIDYDDITIPPATAAGWDEMGERLSTKISIIPSPRGSSTMSRFIKPQILAPIYNTALTTAYGPRRRTWIDCANHSVPHYGFKYLMHLAHSTTGGAEFTLRFDTEITYCISFKNTH